MTEAIVASFYILIFIFLGTLTGGVAVTLISKVFHSNYYYLHVFCGGILAGLIGFDLIPEVISNYQPVGIITGMSLGIFFMIVLDRYLHDSKHFHLEQSETVMLLFLALFMHSMPTGLALGMNFQDHYFQDSSLLGAILIHHIPEGMVMMVSVIYSKMKLRTFWIFCFLLSLAVGINTYLGITLDLQSLKLRIMFMGVAIGTLSYVTFYEILWKGLKNHLTMKMIIAALLGMIFLGFILH